MTRLQPFVLAFLSTTFVALVVQKTMAQDTLRLGQAFVNLTLSVEYFDSLDSRRMSSILAFENNELTSVQDSSFIKANFSLYSLSYSLLNYAKARHISQTKPNPDRRALLRWNRTLGVSIRYYHRISRYPFEANNSFYDFINFKDYSIDNQERNILSLKRKFTPFFNKDIYPDFKRIFFYRKNSRYLPF